MVIVDMIETASDKAVATFTGDDAVEEAFAWFGPSHLCPDSAEPRREMDEYWPELRSK